MDLSDKDLEMAGSSSADASNEAGNPTPPAESVPSGMNFSFGSSAVEDKYAVITNNDPNFKYKYPQAAPTPPGEDDVIWNKVYTAADSRMYNKNGKSAAVSRKFRESGETRELAKDILAENKAKYYGLAAASGSAPVNKPKVAPKTMPKVKKTEESAKESASGSRDATPGDDTIPMSISEKIKFEGRARKAPSIAPSSNQGTPAPPSVAKMNSSPPPSKTTKPSKKGTATAVKKARKQKPGEKASTQESSSRASETPGPRTAAGSDSESNDGGEYCICRGPDDHRMMVYCEGGCEDWYHCSCVKVDEDDAKELLDRFICPNCKTDTLFTTWKRMCRCNNVPDIKCRKAARVATEPPSKYCSDECNQLFWDYVKSRVRTDEKPSMGGALNQNEVRKILEECKTVEEVHALGKKPQLPKKEGADPNRPVGLDYLTPEEKQQIEEIKVKREVFLAQIQSYKDQHKLLLMINERVKIASQQPNLEVKDICGYDNRLSMNEEEFQRWLKSEEGKTAFATGVLGPRTAETKSIGAAIPFPGQVIPPTPEVDPLLDNMCLRGRKKCRHVGWRDVHAGDYVYMQRVITSDLAKLKVAEDEIIEGAETREATKDYDAENETIQLF